MNRFDRQIILPGFGRSAQEKLKNARVLVVGAGGLGCPVLLYLAAAGVGTIGIVDGDLVSPSNLNRQVMYGEYDINKPKAAAAYGYLTQKYADIKINAIDEYITVDNALNHIASYDIVIDGTDNFPARYLINDACVLLKKPLVFGAVFMNEGQVAVFNVETGNNLLLNYRDIYPLASLNNEIPNCAETGVLGVLPGIIGTMMAAECIKLITAYAEPLINKILFYNLLNYSTYVIKMSFNPESLHYLPKNEEELKKMNYSRNCITVETINWKEAIIMQSKIYPDIIIIDVREYDEGPKLEFLEHINIPLSSIENEINNIPRVQTMLLFCQSGIRSTKVAQKLKNKFPGRKIYSIEGGVLALNSEK